MLRQRQKIILKAVCEDYIQTARPVSSAELLNFANLDLSSATLRNEMMELDEKGFLEQPYISAGRRPTSHGYRFFFDNLLNEFELSEKDESLFDEIFKLKNSWMFSEALSELISEMAGTFAVVGVWEGEVAKAGISRILAQPELEESDKAVNFGKLADNIEKYLVHFYKSANDNSKTLIGGENKISGSSDYTIMSCIWKHPRNFAGFAAIVAPIRMNYSKSKKIMDNINLRKNKYE